MINFDKMDTENKRIFEETKPTSKKLGRKPLSDDQKRSEKISVYITKEQKEKIIKMAHENYLNISDFILQKVLNG